MYLHGEIPQSPPSCAPSRASTPMASETRANEKRRSPGSAGRADLLRTRCSSTYTTFRVDLETKRTEPGVLTRVEDGSRPSVPLDTVESRVSFRLVVPVRSPTPSPRWRSLLALERANIFFFFRRPSGGVCRVPLGFSWGFRGKVLLSPRRRVRHADFEPRCPEPRGASRPPAGVPIHLAAALLSEAIVRAFHENRPTGDA